VIGPTAALRLYEAVTLIEAEKAHVERTAPAATHARPADVIELDDYRPRDVLVEYRDHPRPR
jgi:hypothetical protein